MLCHYRFDEKIGEEKIGNFVWSKYFAGGMAPGEAYITYINGLLIEINKPASAGDEKVFKNMISTFSFVR